jgi:hypothetical protein
MHLGIFTFLRRPHRNYPPLPDAAPAEPPASDQMAAADDGARPMSAMVHREPQAEAALDSTLAVDPPTVEAPTPHAFRSTAYAYALTLPAGWTAADSPAANGRPTVDRFRSPDGLTVGLWSEPCPWRQLPRTDGKVTTMTLGERRRVPFVTYTLANGAGSQFLEGSWLAEGKRWSAHVQLPPGSLASDLADVRTLLASFRSDV